MSESTAFQLVKIHDGAILIRSGDNIYQDTAGNYALDAEEDFPPLPQGDIGRTYIPGERHKTTTGGKATQHPIPWLEGDAILATLASLIAAKVIRTTPPPPPILTDEEILTQLENFSKAMKAFLLLYGEREGFTPAQIRNAIKTKMATL